MDIDHSLLLAAAAMVAGVLGSMLGLGGGVFIIPLFTLLLGVDPKIAIGASAVCVVTNSVVGSKRHLQNRFVNFRLAMILQSTTATGAIIGALIALAVNANFLKAIFGLLIFYAVFSMSRNRKASIPNVEPDAPDPWGLMAEYQDGAQRVRYVPQKLNVGLGVSGFAGVLSGLLGIGGGLVQVPVMNMVMKVPLRAAAGTSSFMVGMTSVATAAVFFTGGKIDPSVTAPAMIGVLAGSSLGSWLTKRVKVSQLLGVLLTIMLFMGVTMILSAFNIQLW